VSSAGTPTNVGQGGTASGAGAALSSFVAGLRLMSNGEIRVAVWLTIAMGAASLLEIAAAAAVLPFVNVVIQPDSVRTNELLGRLYRASGARDLSQFILLVGVGVVVLMTVNTIANWGLLYGQNRFAAGCQARLARELFDRCVEAPYSWFLSRNSTMLARLVYDDVVFWSRTFLQRLMMMVEDVMTVIMAVVLVLVFSLGTGIIVITVVGALAMVSMCVTKPIVTRLAERKRTALDTTLLTANQVLAGVKDVKLSSRQNYFSEIFGETYVTLASTHARLNIWQGIPSLVMNKLAQVTLVMLVLVFWNMGLGSGQIATQLALLIIVTTKVVPAASALSSSLSNLFAAVPHINAIREVLASIERETRRTPRREGGRAIGDWHEIRLDRVGYRYPGSSDWALQELTITLCRSGSYGIVGPSAAGKSTLVDLLVGLLEPTEGRVSVGGHPLEVVDLKDWQRRIGYVPQKPFLSDDTLRANVAFGVPRRDVDDRWILECLRLANLATLPDELEGGLDTRLGERGSRLSGGQCQRVAIARALFNRPEILVFDEATSSLDTLSEGEILDALKNLRGQVTLVTIAHRFSTVVHCDEIFVLEGGRLVGRGNYSELETNHDLFRRMAVTTR